MPYRLIVVLTSVTLAFVFAAVGVYSRWQLDERFEQELDAEADRVHNIYLAEQPRLDDGALVDPAVADQLEKISQRLDVGIALLLDAGRADARLWRNAAPPRQVGGQYILAATRPEAEQWLDARRLPAAVATGAARGRMLEWQGDWYHVVAFNLDEPASAPAAAVTVLVWRDDSARMAGLFAERATVLRGTLGGYVVVQIVLLLVLNLARREWEKRLRRNTEIIERLSRRNALLLEAAGDAILGVDAMGNVSFINSAALEMHGYRRDEVMGKNAHHLFHHHRVDGRPYSIETCPMMTTLRDGRQRECEENLFRRDGAWFPVKMTITPIVEQGVHTGTVAVYHDITEQRNRQEALLRLTTTDPLTGACNRRHFIDRLDAEISRQRRHGGMAALLVCEIDDFKQVNDSHGNAMGDAVLANFVHVVRMTVRKTDLVGRIGGTEFAILLLGDSIAQAEELAGRLHRNLLANPARIGNFAIPVDVSVGVTNLRTEDMSADAPIRRAEESLATPATSAVKYVGEETASTA
ncbi:MAG: diguanylate cyclase [Azoarcus sp.]|jgi:diguanylate cyclase (GGDEF)-like protein/PAS domain S-box-containing protein|nr:diguanylate cyclase [Azoarcus sp.]